MSETRVEEVNRKITREAIMSHDTSTVGGIGLCNVHQRIQLHCGEEYGIRVASEEGVGTKVTMKIPLLILSGGISDYA